MSYVADSSELTKDSIFQMLLLEINLLSLRNKLNYEQSSVFCL